MPEITGSEESRAPFERGAVPVELEALRDELAQLSPATFVPMNRDVTAAALLVIGAAPEVRRFRAEMVALFGEEKASLVDRLEVVARAAAAAHAQHQFLSSGQDLLPLVQAATEMRANLVAEVEALVARRRLPKNSLARLARAHGHRNLVADMLLLVSMLQLSWPTIAGATGLTLADLCAAEALTAELATTVGLREQASSSSSADLRLRAYTLLARTWDGVRRMITYIRWDEGDADRIAPSFYGGRRGRRRAGEDAGDAGALEPAGDGAPPGDEGLLGGNPFPSA